MPFKYNPFTDNLDLVGTGSGGEGVATLSDTSGTVVSPDSSGNIQLVGGPGISIVATPASNLLTISSPSGGFKWNIVSTNFQAVAGNGYFIAGSGVPIRVTLPSTATLGDTFVLYDVTGRTFTLVQGAGQAIQVGEFISTTGVGGSVTSKNVGDSATFISVSTGSLTQFATAPYNGNFTVV
jgi:hypothetical protein